MNKVLKILVFSIISILTVTHASGSKLNSFTDTTLRTDDEPAVALPQTNDLNPEPSNLIFPANLASNRAQSLDYIEKFSDKRRSYLIRLYNQGKKIFPKVIAILNRYNLPEELKVLIALESGFNANAVSRAGAVGYWQFMDDVAKEYGLKVALPNQKAFSSRATKDDRTNFTRSTSAAARYLKDRCRNLNNDILLIVASYNWGLGHIWTVMRKCGKANPTFWDIKKYLPKETRTYVMNFITLNVIYSNFEKFQNKTLVFRPAHPSIKNENNIVAADSSNPVITTE